MTKQKELIFIPSMSTGEYGKYCQKNIPLSGSITTRFYSSDFPAEYRHNYFLLTAGHFYKKKGIRKEWGLEDTFVMGDSGGYQIATGAIKWSTAIRQEIFEWLEDNSDVALNIDIPPFANYLGKYEECLEISYDNFKYFEKNQTGKTKFLNVLHGGNLKNRIKWYDKVKGFEFKGWACGGSRAPYNLASSLVVLVQNKEHIKSTNEYLHILGATKVQDFFFLSQVQKSLNEVGSNMQVTTDSSTPSRGMAFGLYYAGVNYKNDSFMSLHIPKQFSANKNYVAPDCLGTILPYQYDLPMPRACEFDKILDGAYTYGDCLNNVNHSQMFMTLHNAMFFVEVQNQISRYVMHHDYLLEQFTTSETFKVMKILDQIIKSDTPEKVLMANEQFLLSLSPIVTDSTVNSTSVSDFFSL